jgi:predicted patatin/cPLA2 family phospholipase
MVVARAEAGTAPGAHGDGKTLALVIEGGGMGGSVSAGMCLVLEALGLVNSFDMVVACSSGALNGAWTAAGQSAQGTTNYLDLATREFMNPWRLALGRAPIDFSLLFERIAVDRKPLLAEGRASGPRFFCLATSVTTGQVRAFGDFQSNQELLRAVRASCTLPVLGGSPIEIDGDRYVDGGLIESMPYASAFRMGATHVLVLRSRETAYRKPPYGFLSRAVVRWKEPSLLEAVRARPGLYNDEAQALEEAMAAGREDLRQITPAGAEDRVDQMERRHEKIVAGVRAGAEAAGRVFAREPVDVLWRPVAYSVG